MCEPEFPILIGTALQPRLCHVLQGVTVREDWFFIDQAGIVPIYWPMLSKDLAFSGSLRQFSALRSSLLQ